METTMSTIKVGLCMAAAVAFGFILALAWLFQWFIDEVGRALSDMERD